MLKIISFNPRARVGRDSPVTAMTAGGVPVSIHAPAWGATLSAAIIVVPDPAFQSTRPRGARLVIISKIKEEQNVSIHAPAWGATREWLIQEIRRYRFQSTRPRGARPKTHRMMIIHGICFNPRARVGRDQLGFCNGLFYKWFQSTRPRGARLLYRIGDLNAILVSIHAPAWGATH